MSLEKNLFLSSFQKNTRILKHSFFSVLWSSLYQAANVFGVLSTSPVSLSSLKVYIQQFHANYTISIEERNNRWDIQV